VQQGFERAEVAVPEDDQIGVAFLRHVEEPGRDRGGPGADTGLRHGFEARPARPRHAVLRGRAGEPLDVDLVLGRGNDRSAQRHHALKILT